VTISNDESLGGFYLLFNIPIVETEREILKTAAKWIKYPMEMLATLTRELNELSDKCVSHQVDEDGVMEAHLKPEYVGQIKGKNLLKLWWEMDFRMRADCVDLVNKIEPTPFLGEILREVARHLHAGNTTEFDQAIWGYRSALQKLSDWIQVKQILSGKGLPEPTGRAGTSASFEDIVRISQEIESREIRPTLDRIGKLLRAEGLTIGRSVLQSMKRKAEKQSAVRPPDSAD